jgi:hypothetical protein
MVLSSIEKNSWGNKLNYKKKFWEKCVEKIANDTSQDNGQADAYDRF